MIEKYYPKLRKNKLIYGVYFQMFLTVIKLFYISNKNRKSINI